MHWVDLTLKEEQAVHIADLIMDRKSKNTHHCRSAIIQFSNILPVAFPAVSFLLPSKIIDPLQKSLIKSAGTLTPVSGSCWLDWQLPSLGL